MKFYEPLDERRKIKKTLSGFNSHTILTIDLYNLRLNVFIASLNRDEKSFEDTIFFLLYLKEVYDSVNHKN